MTNRRKFLEQMTRASVGAAVTLRSGNTSPIVRAMTDSRKPGVVQTVQGPIDASKLGVTLPHEHLCVSSAGFLQTWPEYFGGRANLIAKIADKLKAVREGGVSTIVDVTPADVGRDIRLSEAVSRKSGMQIVACTGHWLSPSLTMSARTVEELTDFFTLEIERGIEGTEIKAGVIKVATDRDGVTPFLEKALRAAARASKATGTPITTHTYAQTKTGEKQAEIFEAEGASPARICIGHSDDTEDMDYLLGLAKRGYTIGMDHLTWGVRGTGDSAPLRWEKRAETVKKLVDAGVADRVFLSNDWFFAISLTPAGAMEALEKTNPDGMLFSTRKVVPYLEEIGVSEATIRMLTIENPQRFLGGVRG